MNILTRRNMLIGLGAALAAPAVVRAESLMRIAPRKLIAAPVLWLGGNQDFLEGGQLYRGVEPVGSWTFNHHTAEVKFKMPPVGNNYANGNIFGFERAQQMLKALRVTPYPEAGSIRV